MYIMIVGAGKVGWNLARELLEKEHEVTVIEADRRRYLTVEQELEHNVVYGDASELWVLERAGVERADMVIAVTGDDEDNILICQMATEKYGVDRVVARCNNPRNLQHFELLGIKPAVSATDLILRLIEHEVPKYGLVHLLDLKEERLEIIEMEVAEGSPAAGATVQDLGGSFTVGTALEIDALLQAGIERADAFVASTDGDNTNLVIAQIAQRRFEVDRVVVRVLDPGRAKWYAEQGLQTICPTQTAIELLEAAVRGQIRFEGVAG